MRLFGVVLVAGLLSVPLTGGPFTASGKINQFFSSGGDPKTGNGSDGAAGATWDHYFDGQNGLTAINSAQSENGLLKTMAAVTMNYYGWESGSISATSSAGLNEIIMPDWAVVAARAGQPDVATMVMGFEVFVGGVVVATSDGGPASSASVDYTARIGDASASGTRSVTAGGGLVETGTWGTLILTATLPFNSNVILDLTSTSFAGAGKTYLSFPMADALGDFSHTLRWGGVKQIIVVNGQGQQTDITGAYIPMIGQSTGFDYFYGVQEPTSGVPEPSTVALMTAGLAGVWCLRRRVRP